MIGEYTKETIVITGKGSLGADGQYADSGGSVTTVARVENSSGIIKTADRGDIAYTLIMYLRASESIGLQDKIVYAGVTYTVLKIYKPAGLGGSTMFIKVWLV